jgi:hypothetical protein
LPPIPSGAAPLDQLPAFGTPRFKSAEAVKAHLRKPAWIPSTYDHGLPTPAEVRSNVAKVYNALIDIRNVWDGLTYPLERRSFQQGGQWSDENDLEAISHRVIAELRNLHLNGATSPGFRTLPGIPYGLEDDNFSYHQRIYWVCFLLRHYKRHAGQFMKDIGISVFVATI